ncbi:IQ calmodulin-binding motif-containing protein [Pandoraea capi]|uniref:2-oxoadipate dioxygenase/decarboxylase n=2 Tax=Pandoraea capi TaxID=2508286 RepID=A0ABY6WCD0_9BURK|nr:IQ calmodulin-binding motif-containing protein [Pandoraea capi]
MASTLRDTPMRNANVESLLVSLIGKARTDALFATLNSPSILADFEFGSVTRAELAQAMNMALFEGLLERSANGRTYTEEAIAAGGGVYFDHGALRTVRWDQNGALPPGESAFTRILRPLGFKLNGRYPLDRLGMTGRAYAHEDCPDEISQFFVSELHPERFSETFQQAVSRVVGTSTDPLTPAAVGQLWELERDGTLPLETAQALLPVIVGAFARQHEVPSEADYELLLAESAEMAWISTEGNAFNHATDRVEDVFALSDAEKAKGRPMKPEVERSRSGRVFQTAYRADTVRREFRAANGELVTREVPGSFYEFITRHREYDNARRCWKLDLRFDAGNAQGIFKMTANAK